MVNKQDQAFSSEKAKNILLPFMMLLSLALLHGCGLFKERRPVFQVPTVKRTGNLRQDLLNRADSIKGLEIRGRLRITVRGKRFPSFNTSIWFFSHEDDLFLRIRGFGPLGVTVFDLLADREEAWIYLPQQGKIFKGNTFFTSYGNIDVETAIRLMEICLNPWSPARYCLSPGHREHAEPSGRVTARLYCRFMGRKLVLDYDLLSFMPLKFESGLAAIAFKAGEGNLASTYPEEISFSLKRDGIRGSLVVKEVKFNSLSDRSPVFDKDIFRPDH